MNLTTIIREPLPLLPRFSVAPEAEERRNELIMAVRQFPAVTNQTQANSLGDAARDLRTYIATVKKQNLEWRRPVNDALSQAMAVEKEHLAPAQSELDAAERVAGAWHAAEQRRVAEAERVRQEELAAKLRDEAAAKALAAETGDAEAVAMAEQATVAVEAALYAPKPEAVKVGGMTTKRTPTWELVDIHKLYAARPDLCHIEPNKAAIKAICVPRFPEKSDEVDETSVPGIKQWWQSSTSTRKW